MELNVQKRYFDMIISGNKNVEGRLAKDKYRLLQIGGTITFTTEGASPVTKKIKSILIFKTFEDAFKEIDFKRAIPDANSPKEAIAVYEKFYPISEQEKYGVVFIGIE